MAAGLIVHDGLVDPAVLAMARPGTRMVSVAKQRSRHTMPQDEINALIVEHARAGKRVVRLKGGDPFVFGRGGEEADHLRAQGLQVDVVNGITSGLAAATALGSAATSETPPMGRSAISLPVTASASRAMAAAAA